MYSLSFPIRHLSNTDVSFVSTPECFAPMDTLLSTCINFRKTLANNTKKNMRSLS